MHDCLQSCNNLRKQEPLSTKRSVYIFHKGSVRFLGHMIDKDGIPADLKKHLQSPIWNHPSPYQISGERAFSTPVCE